MDPKGTIGRNKITKRIIAREHFSRFLEEPTTKTLQRLVASLFLYLRASQK